MFSSELDIIAHCFSGNETEPEELIDGVLIKRIEHLPCKPSKSIAVSYTHLTLPTKRIV